MPHTPKPWRPAGGCYINIEAGDLADGSFRNIARVGIDKAHCPSDDECEANAALIIAAPDLLAACEALPDFDIESPDACDFKDHALAFMTAMRLARAAIAKATGK